MAKRFTDTTKWKRPFIRGLSPIYKLLWYYIIDDCDVAGLWIVDMEIASIYIGDNVTEDKALNAFGDKIIKIDKGEKWFIPDFIEFQYGSKLSKTNNIYKSIERVLSKYNLFQYLNVEITEEGETISSFRNRISQKIKDKIFLDNNMTCQYCQSQKLKNELVVDHIIPLKKGGNNEDENLTCSCIRCNSHKTDIDPEEFINKNYDFLNPTDNIKSIIKKLKAPIKGFKPPKDKDKVKELVKGKVKELNLNEDFESLILKWLKYKTEKGQTYKETGLDGMIKKLAKLSNNTLLIAELIINDAISNNYSGFFAIKDNGTHQQILKRKDEGFDNSRLKDYVPSKKTN